jgi:hypothetical protein
MDWQYHFIKQKILLPDDNIRFSKSSLEDHAALLQLYKKQIAIPYDDFLEEYILGSEIFSIEVRVEKCRFLGSITVF